MSRKSFAEMNWQELAEQLSKDAQKKKIPQSAAFELTPLCNFNCGMCYVHLRADQMLGRQQKTAREWIHVGEEVKKAGGLFLLLTGGEVFTRSDFRQIYTALSDMGFLLMIYSNGYLMDEKVIAWLKEIPPLKLRITMYGASDATYEKVCEVPDGFTVVSRNIRLLKDAKIPLSIAMTVVQDNAAEVSLVADFAKRLEIPFTYTTEVVKSQIQQEDQERSIRLPQDFLWEAYCGEEEDFVDGIYPQATNESLSLCGSKDRGIWIRWDGKMSMCSFISSIAADPFTQPFQEAWATLQKQMEQLKKPKQCQDCKFMKFCSVCPGVREAETGSPGGFDEKLCNKARKLYEKYVCRYKGEVYES